jgi:diguanylate cyclase (GGDEF)-like protein
MRLPIQRKLFYSHFVAVVLVSGSIGTLFYKSASDSLFGSLQARLKYSAALLSRTLDANGLAEVRSPADVERPAYRDNLALLRDFRDSNPDIAFIYVMRREDSRTFFVLDTDDSPGQALPGKEFTADAPLLLAGFDAIAADDRITRDEWGHFLSGYAPLRSGEGRYLIGIDMRADEVHRKFQAIRVAGALSLLLSVVLAYLFSRFLAARITRPIMAFVSRAREIAVGQFDGTVKVRTGDELDDLARGFNTMSQHLQASHERVQRALAELEEAKGTLEERVAERTSRLEELNRQLTAEVQERTRAEQALAHAATTDSLTGLLNRRAMIAVLEQEAERSRRSGRPFALAMADVDGFKAVNDEHGHRAGDELLLLVCRTLRETLRGQDAIARWGGDEILALLPETDLAGAMAAAEKSREALCEREWVVAARAFRPTISLGVATFTPQSTVEDVLARADQALYRAKAAGRNRTAAAAE